MTPDETLLRALRSRDRRFDGTFFVTVRSTRVYCRPICPARAPQVRNVGFVRTAAEAERLGFRPCLRCRPELAPGRALVDATARLARAAVERIAAGGVNGRSVAALARDLCVGERHLRRVLVAELGATPVELAQTQRLLLAKQLLTETDLPVTRVAFASGFSSVSRFNALFAERYRMSPTRLRRTRGSGPRSDGAIRLLLAYRPPYEWDVMLGFLAARTIAGVERVADGAYLRTVRVGDCSGWIAVRQGDPARAVMELELAESLLPVLPQVRAGVRRLFDLDAEPARVRDHLGSDAHIGARVRARPGLRLPGAVDGFEMAMRAVLGQQVSVRAAITIAGRVAAAYGCAIETPYGMDRLSPTAASLADADPDALARLGMPGTRAATLVRLAQHVERGDVDLSPGADPDATAAALVEIPGIGPWTAQYIAMRALHWPDAFPATDLGVKRALAGVDAATVAEAWRPWRAYAVLHLWNG